MSYSDSEKAASKILSALDVLRLSPVVVGQILARSEGSMKYRVYLVVRAIVATWEIDIKHNQDYQKEHKEIYEWVKGLRDNG